MAPRPEEKAVTLSLPLDLFSEIEAKAKGIGVDLDQLIPTLLRFGLQVQRNREEALYRLYSRMHATEDAEEKDRLSEELCKELFG